MNHGIRIRQYTPLLRALSQFSVCNLHQHRVIYELRGYSSNGVESGGEHGGTRGSQFQLHIHSSPLVVEWLRRYLQPFILHTLSAISLFRWRCLQTPPNFCTLRSPLTSHFTSVQFFLAYYRSYKSATLPKVINHPDSYRGKHFFFPLFRRKQVHIHKSAP